MNRTEKFFKEDFPWLRKTIREILESQGNPYHKYALTIRNEPDSKISDRLFCWIQCSIQPQGKDPDIFQKMQNSASNFYREELFYGLSSCCTGSNYTSISVDDWNSPIEMSVYFICCCL